MTPDRHGSPEYLAAVEDVLEVARRLGHQVEATKYGRVRPRHPGAPQGPPAAIITFVDADAADDVVRHLAIEAMTHDNRVVIHLNAGASE